MKKLLALLFLLAPVGVMAAPNLGQFEAWVVPPTNKLMLMPFASPARTQYGFAVATTPAAAGGTQTTAMSMSLAPGEYEPLSFSLSSTTAVAGLVRLLPTDLHGPSGATIPLSEIDIRAVKVWYQGEFSILAVGRTNNTTFTENLVPELLLHNPDSIAVTTGDGKNTVSWTGGSRWVNQHVNDPESIGSETFAEFPWEDTESLQPFTIPTNYTQQFYVTVHAPTNTPAGVYSGRIRVMIGRTLVGSMTISATVHPFVLEDPALETIMFYRGQFQPATAHVGSELKNLRQYSSEIKDILDHGIKGITIYEGSPNNYEQMRKALQIRHDLGAPRDKMVLISINMDGTLASIEAEAALYKSVLDQYGYRQQFIYGRDEPSSGQLADQVTKWTALRAAGYGTITAGSDATFDGSSGQLRYFAISVTRDPARAATAHAAGNKLCLYNMPQSTAETPHAMRLNVGLGPWSQDYDCYMMYAYQHCMGSCWNDVDHPATTSYRDHTLTLPTKGRPVPTIAWEGLREGIDDLRYLQTLNRLIAIAPAGAEKTAAESYLSTLKSTLSTQYQAATSANLGFTVTIDFPAERANMVAHITALRD